MMMASAQVVETSVNTNNSPSQDYATNPDDHSNHNKFAMLNKVIIPKLVEYNFVFFKRRIGNFKANDYNLSRDIFMRSWLALQLTIKKYN